SIFYMGINIGALISPLICGWVGERYSWRLGFGIAGLGMAVGLIQFLLGARHLGSAGLHPVVLEDKEADRRPKRNAAIAPRVFIISVLGLVVLAATGTIELTAETISNALGVALIAISAGIFAWLLLGPGWSPVERKRFGAILVLFLASAVFW